MEKVLNDEKSTKKSIVPYFLGRFKKGSVFDFFNIILKDSTSLLFVTLTWSLCLQNMRLSIKSLPAYTFSPQKLICMSIVLSLHRFLNYTCYLV